MPSILNFVSGVPAGFLSGIRKPLKKWNLAQKPSDIHTVDMTIKDLCFPDVGVTFKPARQHGKPDWSSFDIDAVGCKEGQWVEVTLTLKCKAKFSTDDLHIAGGDDSAVQHMRRGDVASNGKSCIFYAQAAKKGYAYNISVETESGTNAGVVLIIDPKIRNTGDG